MANHIVAVVSVIVVVVEAVMINISAASNIGGGFWGTGFLVSEIGNSAWALCSGERALACV